MKPLRQAQPTLEPQHAFSRVPRAEINRSSFDRSFGYKTTFDAGYLVPFFRDLAFPGDTFAVQPAMLARIATLIRPIMDRMFLDVHFWAVPLRLLYTDWIRLQGERDNPADSINYSTPKIKYPAASPVVAVGSLADYLGIPPLPRTDDLSVAAWYTRAYNMIWNYNYRDENLQNSVQFDTDAGPDDPADYVLLRRGKRHDYFTSALPSPQKGNAVQLPLGATAPLIPASGLATDPIVGSFFDGVTDGILVTPSANAVGVAVNTVTVPNFPANWGPSIKKSAIMSALVVDLASANSVTVNTFRQAVTVQQVLETDMRGGTRFPEMIAAHFGVLNPDARMQRPEFLGGGSIPLDVHQVAQTAPGTTSNQADLSAFGLAAHSGKGLGFTQSFTEHCVVLGLVSARADLTYQQGIRRDYRYDTRYDYYLPTFANLGEQPLRTQEIRLQATDALDDVTWAYQERWAEMRYYPSELTGLMRTFVGSTLGKYWTLAQDLVFNVGLDATFIEENPPVDDVIAVPSEPHFIGDFFVNFRCIRAMPLYSVPGLHRI